MQKLLRVKVKPLKVGRRLRAGKSVVPPPNAQRQNSLRWSLDFVDLFARVKKVIYLKSCDDQQIDLHDKIKLLRSRSFVYWIGDRTRIKGYHVGHLPSPLLHFGILASVVVSVYMPIFFARAIAANGTEGNKTVVVHHNVKIREHDAVALKALPILRLTNQRTVVVGVLAEALAPSLLGQNAVGSKAREGCQGHKNYHSKN